MRWSKGQSLIEVVIAVGIIGMASVVLVSAVTRAMANNRLSKERIIATRLAQEGWEWLQRQAGDDWEGLYSQVYSEAGGNPVDYCLPDEDIAGITYAFDYVIESNHDDDHILSVGACDPTQEFELADTNYQRAVSVDPVDEVVGPVTKPEHLQAKVTVTWPSRGRDQTVEVEGTISK